MNNIIYLDNASTTKVDERVLETFNKAHQSYFANPSSIHKLGQEATYLLNRSKDEILSNLKLKDHQIIYTSGATEANNLAIKGAALEYKSRGKHIITSIYEHASVLEAVKQLSDEFGYKVTYVRPNSDGIITVDNVISQLTSETVLVSIMAVNNEIGAINPIKEIGEALKKYPKVIYHVDASQLIGKTDKLIDLNTVDLLTISAHKIHGLVGYGALIKRKKLTLLALSSGGGQEYNFRSGTNDLAGALALAKTIDLALKSQKDNYEKVRFLANRIIEYLSSKPEYYELNLPHPINSYIINFSTKKKGSVVVEALSNHNIMVSSISACSSSKEKGSYVVKSLGKSDETANNTVRISLDATNTSEEIETFIKTIDQIMGEIR